MRGIYLLDVSDDEHHDDDIIDNEAKISLHALSGANTAETMRLPLSVQDQALITMIDSNSTHYFMVARVARRLNLTPTTKDGMTMGVANGERLPCLEICAALLHQRRAIMHRLPHHCMESYEMVLGCNWLCTLGPIVWDFSRLSMAFWWLDHRVK
jgi:hypothetical protein